MKAANSNIKCPTCHGAATVNYHPFCSKRCSAIDLGRWFNESYVIPGETTSQEAADEDDFDQ
jgi:uncharacterized protein